MKIAASQLDMQSSHLASQTREIAERLRVVSNRPESAPPQFSSAVQLSNEGLQRANQTRVAGPELDFPSADPMLSFLKTMLWKMFGVEVDIFSGHEMTLDAKTERNLESISRISANGAASGVSAEYERHEVYRESESLRFAAQGTVLTEDGQEIEFSFHLEMSRTFVAESHTAARFGEAAKKKDPLVINFNGPAAKLSDQRFLFDLDSDGQQDAAHFVAPGSGFLVFDRDGSGAINRANELFGPTTGDGFAELAALDDDRNGWIDENDGAYSKLQLWTKAMDGSDLLQQLSDADVGAISLARLLTPFAIKNADNRSLGDVRSSGVYLKDSGGAGSIQQVDLTV